MATYQHNFGSQFPDVLIETGTRKNIDNSVVSLVNQYNAFLRLNDYVSANALYQANRATLAPYRVDCDYCNRIEEEIYNTGLMAISQQNTIISSTEPTVTQVVGSIWLKEY